MNDILFSHTVDYIIKYAYILLLSISMAYSTYPISEVKHFNEPDKLNSRNSFIFYTFSILNGLLFFIFNVANLKYARLASAEYIVIIILNILLFIAGMSDILNKNIVIRVRNLIISKEKKFVKTLSYNLLGCICGTFNILTLFKKYFIKK